MSILVVGSVALDSVETPSGAHTDALGGSCVYFSLSASYHASVRMVGVVGDDFPARHVGLLERHRIDTAGLQRVPGRTFRWKGHYLRDLNAAETLDTQLNVFARFSPVLPERFRDSAHVFLANIDPELQLQVLDQVRRPRLVACDTMNFWISGKRGALLRTLRRVDILLVNEAEARQLSGEKNLVTAARRIRAMGPRILVIKRGEYGALCFSGSSVFAAPALPLERVKDPTGAGDTFAGGFMGHLSRSRTVNDAALRRAVAYGSVMASFTVEDFSVRRLSGIGRADIERRFREYAALISLPRS